MKEILTQFAQYNVWANKLIIDTMLSLDNSLVTRETASSFPTVEATVKHIWSAESIWLQRVQNVSEPVWLGGTFVGAFADVCAQWQQTSRALADYVQCQNDDKAFTGHLHFTNRAKVAQSLPVHQVLLHIFNHTTYHRGQLVTMLRQLGVVEIPTMYFIALYMKTK